MEALFVYLVKSGALLATFYLAYHFLLRKETFFNSNRWFLLLGLVTSILLPLVTFKKIVWVDPIPEAVGWSDMPARIAAPVVNEGFEIDWFIVMGLVYAIGIFIFLIKFIFDFGSLAKTLKGHEIKQQADFKLVDVNHNVSPFSYFSYIVYNSSLYSAEELENILEHEKVHCEQKHSADVLISRLFCILFWFNPFAWLYKKAILQNLEFIADSGALKNLSDKKAYQITLLKVTTHEHCVEITNHFYQSLIKKRIIMLNKSQSKKSNSWKYALIIPVLAAFLFYFQVKVIAQERHTDVEATEMPSGKPINITINKNTTDAQLNAYTTEFKKQYGAKLKFSKVKRNSAGEIIGLKAVYSDKNGKSGTYQLSGDEPIKPINITRQEDGKIAFGNSKQIRIIRDKDGEDAADTEDAEGSYTYSYSTGANGDHEIIVNGEHISIPEPPEMPDMPDMVVPPAACGKNVVVKTITNKDGKVVVSVNGEVIDVDTDKILADIDINIDEIKEQAKAGARLAKEQAKLALRHAERARKQAGEASEDSEETRQEMEETRREMEETRREMEETRRELEQARQELSKARAAAKAAKAKKASQGQ
ncbi:M56 family metallopeptidase [Flavobacterium sp.]|uniref:M56 family metallopeptidase n=1 Tax=Flavobacterium sp. TaxID=239 RepID=UPI0039E58B8A